MLDLGAISGPARLGLFHLRWAEWAEWKIPLPYFVPHLKKVEKERVRIMLSQYHWVPRLVALTCVYTGYFRFPLRPPSGSQME